MDLNRLLYNHPHDIIPAKGSLLIADPMMEEIHFRRSVVMLLDTDSTGGHLGLALNKATNLTLRDIMPECEAGEDVPVFCGGPVDLDRLFLLHTLGKDLPGAEEVIPGIFVGGSVEDIVDYINSGIDIEGRLRFFLGYSGWRKDQLATELEGNSWAVNRNPEASGLLSGEENDYWRRQVEQLGSAYRSWLMVPPHPSFN